MKRLIAFLVVVVIVGVVALLLTTFPANREAIFPGYMEADLVLVGSEQGGRVETLSVQEGDNVDKGTAIFTLESTEQEVEVAAAEARVTEAEARLADVRQQMQRPGEIEVLDAALARGQGDTANVDANAGPNRKLFDKGWIAKAQLDDAIAQHDRNQAAVNEAERRIEAARSCPDRSDMIDAAAASVETARHSLEQAEKELAKRKVFAPASGTVEEVYFRPGEVVKEGQAVIALLPPGNLKVRFFVAEPVRATLQHRADRQGHLRRLSGRPHGHDQLHCARGRIHAAGHLLAGAAAEARVPGRGEAFGEARARSPPDSR